MVEELAMISVLAGMGVYFVKSTDLPKDLLDKSKVSSTRETVGFEVKKPQFNRLKINNNEAIDREINELTYKITALEQEIKVNNAKNAQILKEIDTYMAKLEVLNQDRIS